MSESNKGYKTAIDAVVGLAQEIFKALQNGTHLSRIFVFAAGIVALVVVMDLAGLLMLRGDHEAQAQLQKSIWAILSFSLLSIALYVVASVLSQSESRFQGNELKEQMKRKTRAERAMNHEQ